jgi:two-component system cell cycle sensor histidine kinase/response regulator CckA
VTAAEFSAFAGRLGLEERDPGVRSIAFIASVRREDLPRWVERQRSRGNDVGRVMTTGESPLLYLVQYSAPALRGARTVGWDVSVDPLFRAAIERARDTGQAALAGPLAIPHATRGPIFALEYPYYGPEDVPKTAEALRSAFQGTFALFLNVRSFMDEALAGSDPDIEVALFDGPVPDPLRRLYTPSREAGSPAPQPRARRVSDVLSIGGTTLTLVFTALPGFDRTEGTARPLLVLGGGLAMSGLLFGLLWAVSSARGRALGLAEESTISLRESERRYREVLVSMADGFLAADRKTLAILDANPALERMVGFSRAELLSRTVFDLSGHERDSLVLNAARAAEVGSFHAGERLYTKRDGTNVRLDTSLLLLREGTREVLYAFLRDAAGPDPQEGRTRT